ncbi:MAG TPA: hypothetical protein VEA15_10215 [Caulobacteraceae bacterium]|nr:hypothetical protein [Caulobacteraceae bacterium]
MDVRRWAATLALCTMTAFVAPGAARAAETPPAPAVSDDDIGTAAAERRYDPTKIICRRTRPPTGSRVSRGPRGERICLTTAEWDRRSEEARQNMRDGDRGVCGGHASGGCTMPGVAPGSER